MTIQDIERLYAYNHWANARTIEAAAALGDEKLHRDCHSSFPTVYATLVHMLGAEWVWLERWNGSSPTAFPDMQALRTLGELRARWQPVETGTRTFIGGLDDPALDRPLSYCNLKGEPFTEPLGFALQHVANHATYHRGQITTMTRQLGGKPAGTDFIAFVRE